MALYSNTCRVEKEPWKQMAERGCSGAGLVLVSMGRLHLSLVLQTLTIWAESMNKTKILQENIHSASWI